MPKPKATFEYDVLNDDDPADTPLNQVVVLIGDKDGFTWKTVDWTIGRVCHQRDVVRQPPNLGSAHQRSVCYIDPRPPTTGTTHCSVKRNTVELDHYGRFRRSTGLGPVVVAGSFDVPLGVLAFHDARVGSWSAPR